MRGGTFGLTYASRMPCTLEGRKRCGRVRRSLARMCTADTLTGRLVRDSVGKRMQLRACTFVHRAKQCESGVTEVGFAHIVVSEQGSNDRFDHA